MDVDLEGWNEKMTKTPLLLEYFFLRHDTRKVYFSQGCWNVLLHGGIIPQAFARCQTGG